MNPTHVHASEERLLAKSAAPGAARGESLKDHTHNVVRALSGLRQLWPDLPTLLDAPRLWHLAFWACVLHDFGKAASGFQQQLLPGGTVWRKRHEVLSLMFVDWLLPDMEHADRPWLSAAIASHHRDRSVIEDRYPLHLDPEDDALMAMVTEIPSFAIDELWHILTVDAPAWRLHYAFDQVGVEEIAFPPNPLRHATVAKDRDAIVLALTSYFNLARRLTRTDARLGKTLLALTLRGIVVTADHQASAGVFGLHPVDIHGSDSLLSRMDRSWAQLHQHQRDAAQASGSRILTAPTGSGKTEAALLWASNQAVHAPVPRLFYVLPFQASMNAMHQRLTQLFPQDVALQHGRSLHALYRQLVETEPTPRDAERIARREKNLATLHYHAVRVLSPYQLLKACYRLPGYEAILTDLYNSCFILDEIHAYEPKRLALILKMCGYLRQHYGVRFFVMSATLPLLVQQALEENLRIDVSIAAHPALYKRYCRHTLHVLEGDLQEDGIPAITQAIERGLSVLVCCNTVRRAQAVWGQLVHLLGDDITIELLHSRFNARDRLGKEESILTAMAAGAARITQVVLVATQVIEVSLNIDFDVLFTDPAPLEALLQRFGRVNRLSSRGLAPVYVFTHPDDGQHVYDADLVQGALRVLRTVDGNAIEEQETGNWLDQVYNDARVTAWRANFEAAAQEFDTAILSQLHAFQSDDVLEQQFYKAFDAVEILPLSLEAEFITLRDTDPLNADSLLVSVPYSLYSRLQRRGKVIQRKDPWPRVVDVSYSSQTGLGTDTEEDTSGRT